MITMVREVRKGKLDSVMPMIAKKARATYGKLPTSEQMGTSIEDLIEEGKIVAVTRAAKMWNPNRSAKFSTYLFACLDNYFTDKIRSAYSEPRYARVISADSTIVPTKSGKEMLLFDLIKKSKKDRIEDSIIARIDAERGFLRAYALASVQLRRYLIQWILQPNNVKLKDGVDMREALQEYRIVAAVFLPPHIVRTIQIDYECRFRIANTLFDRFSTPSAGRKVAHNLSETVERRLVPLLSPAKRRLLEACK